MPTPEIALITGASSGLGAEFARQLAAQGYHLILVARRQARLLALAAELEQTHAITAEVLVADLARPDDIERVKQRLGQVDKLSLLVNNAGFGTAGNFADIDLNPQLDMVHVHVLAAIHLCRAALPGMIARGRGAIINVSSIAGLAPLPGNVTYCATKAYLNMFSEALQIELAGTGVQVQALCPGFTITEFHDSPEFAGRSRSRSPNLLWLSAAEVVTASLRALKKDRVRCVPGLQYKFLAMLIHLTPAFIRQWLLVHRRHLRRMLRPNA
ncbi:MAG: SDR family oxidoreductase [Chloroflexota bacterium]